MFDRRRPGPRVASSLLAALPLLLAAGCGGGDRPTAPPAHLPPSVVLISIDTLRAGHMSLYGYERDTTPYLERLAAECLVFDAAHASAPWTLTTHITMLTGVDADEHRIVRKDRALSPEIPLLAERLRARAYRTLGFYRPGWVHPRFGFDRGFDVFETHLDAEEADAHMREAFAELRWDRPLFLFLHLNDVHCKGMDRTFYEPPPPYDRLWSDGAVDRLDGLPWRELLAGEGRLSAEQLEDLVALYDGGIRYVDAMLERWIEGWRRDGLLDRAVLVITADHGESLGTRGSIRGHGKVFQEGLHVPLLVRLPGGERGGERIATPVAQADVVPTVLDALGLPPDPRLTGVSLLGEIPADRVLYAERGGLRAYVRWPWKVVVRSAAGLSRAYHLEDDPREVAPLRDVAPTRDAFAERRDEVLRAFEDQRAARPRFDAPPIPIAEMSASERAELERLGYLGGG